MILRVLALILAVALGAPARATATEIRVVNVFTGVPQPSEGAGRTGGFGDVAANLVAAVELKARHPEMTVRLMVTSVQRRYLPIVPTTNEILKIMVPALDPTLKDEVQNYQGVEVVFMGYDFYPYLDEEKPMKREDMIPRLLRELPPYMRPSDLNLSFSRYEGFEEALRIGTPLMVSVEEHFGIRRAIYEADAATSRTGAVIDAASGPNSLGFMLIKSRPSRAEAFNMIHEWARGAGIALPAGEFDYGMAYSASWQATQVYVDAVRALAPATPLVLIIKDFAELDAADLPSTVRLVRVKGLPHEVMSAMIQECSLSPMVTGDGSLGQALSSTKPEKTLIYETPQWKRESAAGMRRIISRRIGQRPHDLSEMFPVVDQLEKLSRDQLRAKGEKVAALIGDATLQGQIHEAVVAQSARWDLLDNVLTLARTFNRPAALKGRPSTMGDRANNTMLALLGERSMKVEQPSLYDKVCESVILFGLKVLRRN